MILELLLVNHPLDCPICDKGGECDLQDYAMAYARGDSDVADPKTAQAEGRRSRADDRARRRALRRLPALRALRRHHRRRSASCVVKDRGAHDIIATATGEPYRHNFTGNVTELCPVGALTSKTYRFKSRPWDLNAHADDLHAVRGRLPAVCRRPLRRRCCARCRSSTTTRSPTAGCAIAAATTSASTHRPTDDAAAATSKDGDVRADRLGRRVRAVAQGDRRRDALHGRDAASARSAAGGLTNEEAYVLQHVFRVDRRRRISIGAPGGSAKRRPAPRAARSRRSNARKRSSLAGDRLAERAPVLWLRVRKAALRAGAVVVRDELAGRRAGARFRRMRAASRWCGTASISPPAARSPARSRASRNSRRTSRANKATRAAPRRWACFRPVRVRRRGSHRNGRARDVCGRRATASSSALSIFGANPVRNAPGGAALATALAKIRSSSSAICS